MPKLRVVLLVALATLFSAVPASAAGPVQPRIVPGSDPAADGEYPWTVALVSDSATPGPKRAFCGGTLIAPGIVLTAAHCTIGSAPGDFDVVAGDFDLASVDDDHLFGVTRISLHPLAEGGDDDVVPRRDVSLLTLDGDVTPLAPAAQPATVGAPSDLNADDPTSFTVSGWGITDDSNGDTVAVMRHATIGRSADSACTSIFDENFGSLVFSPVDQICAIGDPSPGGPPDDDEIVDTCNGDSGGPLMWNSTGTATADSATGWKLIGVTSWGLGCAVRASDGEPIPGVYARAAGTQLNAYVTAPVGTNSDPAPEQPWHDTGTPQIATPGDGTLYCAPDNPSARVTWNGNPDEIEQLIRRRWGPDDYETVSFTGYYVLDEGDYSDQFVCELRARRSGAGGYGVARSGAVQVEDAPVIPPTIVEVPVPFPVPTPVLVPVPGPTSIVEVPVDRTASDDRDPRVSSVRRSCTKRRVCTFTIRATDTGTGVKTVAAALNTVRTRSCRRNGKRTTCASWRETTLKARAVEGSPGTFRVVTKRLTRGTHVLHLRAVDRAGTIQATPRRVPFRLR